MTTKFLTAMITMTLLIGCSTGDEYESPPQLPEQLNIDLDMASIEIDDVRESEVTIFEEDDYGWVTDISYDYKTTVRLNFDEEYKGFFRIQFSTKETGEYTCTGDKKYLYYPSDNIWEEGNEYWAYLSIGWYDNNLDRDYKYYAPLNSGKITVENLDNGKRKVTLQFSDLKEENMIMKEDYASDYPDCYANITGSFEYESEYAASANNEDLLIGTWVNSASADCPGSSWSIRRTFYADGTSKVELWDCNMTCSTGDHIMWHMVDWEIVDGQLHLFNPGPGHWCGYETEAGTSEDFLDFDCDGETLTIYGSVTTTFTKQ